MQEKKCQSMIIYLLVMDLINLAETEEREGEGKIGKNWAGDQFAYQSLFKMSYKL